MPAKQKAARVTAKNGRVKATGKCEKRHKFRDHFCTYCYKRFPNFKNLESHIFIHTGLRPFSCTICFKCFNNFNNLQKHKSCVHFGVKKYSCNICGRRFSELTNVKQHLATLHDKRRNFVCALCDCRFLSKRYLQRHIETSHLGLSLLCRSCGNSFSNKVTLNEHRASAHFKVNPLCVSTISGSLKTNHQSNMGDSQCKKYQVVQHMSEPQEFGSGGLVTNSCALKSHEPQQTVLTKLLSMFAEQ